MHKHTAAAHKPANGNNISTLNVCMINLYKNILAGATGLKEKIMLTMLHMFKLL